MESHKALPEKLAYALSVLLYPLFVSTYVIIVFCQLFSRHVLPLTWSYQLLTIGGTLFFTCLLPLGILGWMIWRGKVSNLDVTNRSERSLPYLYAIGCIGCWCYFLHVIHMPKYIVWSAIASLIILILVTLITLKWKISAHLSSMGGATAMLIAIMAQCGIYSPLTIILLMLLSWLLMVARIRLQAHTPEQTVAGYLLGFIGVLIPNIILLYAA